MKRIIPIAFSLVPLSARAAERGLDASLYPGPAWSPYLVGAGIGILSWLTFYVSDKAIGASSFYANLAGMIGKVAAPRRMKRLCYFEKNPPGLSWGFLFVVCIVLGGWIAAASGGEFSDRWVPQMWEDRFGDSSMLRGVFAFTGGMLMAFGARLAGGCTSGHGISGSMQLNVASWIAVICFFLGGTVVAFCLFHFFP